MNFQMTLDQKAAMVPKIPIMSFDEIQAVYNTHVRPKKQK